MDSKLTYHPLPNATLCVSLGHHSFHKASWHSPLHLLQRFHAQRSCLSQRRAAFVIRTEHSRAGFAQFVICCNQLLHTVRRLV